MNEKEKFLKCILNKTQYKSKRDLIENLYLKAVVDSYQRINKTIGIENDIRDRFIDDFYKKNFLLKDWIEKSILFVNWERWVYKNKNDLGRSDLSFAITGFEFVVECKRLEHASQKYIDNGLLRFLNNEYSKNESYSAMFGFVVKGDINKICSKIMVKCKTNKSVQNRFTKQKYSGWNYTFNSTHSRINNNDINVYHLFFEFML